MNLMDYIQQGGVIVYILIALNIIGFTTMLVKFIQIIMTKRYKAVLLEEVIADIKEKEVPLKDEHIIVELIKDEMSKKLYTVESGLGTVKIIASISPLLGLLGTVTGVLLAFEAISKSGMGDPSVFAGGISMALITTVAGLIVAIPHYIGYNYLIGMLDGLEATVTSEILPAVYKK
ncbi:MotA/TolQ/ExbB proton channel family protein [Sulfurimonas lithotrophica]|uniref:MotA/TolQ/ExbB proton channel family protein n=1 Tax=Sulfurimonas lithotrophica TaxID=2590022 RepID=A0A5P8P379_9BACT|nr:MotA/TolQ/ExbB proton channel family protein [Sulfurimonas lithotrophica]QFR50000.1 MotA/TolQ/ExbB proton channel family protein [Sulfurimonas lithotrophica]